MLSSSPYEPPSRSGVPLTSKRLASSLELAVGFGIRPYGQQIPPHRGSLSRKSRQGTGRLSRGRDEYGLTPPGLSPPSSAERSPAGRGRGRAEGLGGATTSSGSHPSSSSASSTNSCAHPDCCETKPLFPPSPTEETFSASTSSRRRTTTLKTYLLHLLLAPPSPPVTLLASTTARSDAYLSSSTDSDDSYFSPRTPTDGEEVGQGGQISLGSPEVELVGGGADVTDRASAFARALEEALGDWVGEERSDEGQSAQRGTRRVRTGGEPRGRAGQQVPVRADKSAGGGMARPNTSSAPSTPPRRTSVEFGTCPLSSPTPSDTTDDEEPPALPPRKKSAASTLSSLLSSLLSLPLLTHTSHLPQLSSPSAQLPAPTPPLPPPTTTSPRPDPDACECFTSSLPLLRMPPLPPAKTEVLRPSFPTLREAALRRWVIQREMRKKGKIAVEVPWWESARVWGRCFGREKEGEGWGGGWKGGSGLRWEVVG